MSQYSRSNKNQKPEEKADTRPSRGEKVKQGLSVFQTVVATIASLLGIIVTSFTIMSLLNKDNQKTEDKPFFKATIVDTQIDENGNEKELKYYNLVCAKDLKEANTLMEQHLSQGLSDMRLDAIVKTKIIDLI